MMVSGLILMIYWLILIRAVDILIILVIKIQSEEMHYPVMLQNVIKSIANLNTHRRLQVVDCNFGLGGHSTQILKTFPNTFITGYDLDATTLQKYPQTPYLSPSPSSPSSPPRLTLLNTNYTHLTKSPKSYDILLADLGFNSVQLESYPGFSWNVDSVLDMRYSGQGEDCASFIGRLTVIELVEVFVKFGDLGFGEARIVAEKIMAAKPIKTTFQLRDTVVGCFQTNKTRKIAQIFQALRIAVNKQLESLKILCQNFPKIMNKNGLILMITFHSLQRDIIHRQIKEQQKLFSKIKTETPSPQEIQENSRSRSAQMLIFRKL